MWMLICVIHNKGIQSWINNGFKGYHRSLFSKLLKTSQEIPIICILGAGLKQKNVTFCIIKQNMYTEIYFQEKVFWYQRELKVPINQDQVLG